ncbi:MAG: 16S rRNA (adenine(1518)-N(6)/adenine(1519)-N(6))-dimethyltransferase RsmA [Gemmatimonadota bacterium]|nr:16S rRNA (adenine(1518)-N(6)/adenine(1519)-N(6))-dimethyltransferase RsmA [Gemmatimonadota bacterium]
MVRPKRSLSQNFLVDKNIRRKLVETLAAEPGDAVVEVGPGHGELSELMIGTVRRLVLIEKDDRLAPLLSDRWGDRPDVLVVHGDALEVDWSSFGTGSPVRFVSNVPYAITSPLIFRLLDAEPEARRIVVLVQEEVARRITAAPGGKEYGALSVGVQTRARARLAFRVGRQAFRPVPGVDSAAVVMEPFPGRTREEIEAVRRLARAAFSRRRKQLGTILRTAPEYHLGPEEVGAVTLEFGIDPTVRPEQIGPEPFAALAMRLESLRG